MAISLPLQVELTAEEVGFSTWDVVLDSNSGIGWLINLGLIAMLIFAIYVFYERFFALKRASREEDDFIPKIKNLLLEGDLDAAKRYCSNSESPSARILEKGISRLGKPIESIASSVENAAKIEAMKLKKGLPFLAMASGVAPLIGLFGFAVHAFGTFVDLSADKVLNGAVLSSGMMVSLVSLIIGVKIGAAAFAGYKYLVSKIEKVTYQMEADSIDFMDLLHQA